MSTKEMLYHLQALDVVVDFSGNLYGTPDRAIYFTLTPGNRLREDDLIVDTLCRVALERWLYDERGDAELQMTADWGEQGLLTDPPGWEAAVWVADGTPYRAEAQLPGLALYKAFAQAYARDEFKEST